MKEIIEKRRTHCKVFDLGGRKRKVRVSRAPLHYVRDGKLVDINTTPRLAGKLLEVTEAPYRLKIDPDRPAYLYTTETGRQVEVELIEVGGQPVNARSAQEAGTVRWRGVAPQTDAAFRPLRKGIEALVVLYGPDAPRTWKWRVRGDKELLLPPKGHDAKQRHLELVHSYDGDILTVEWTGRATNRYAIRKKKGWTEAVYYPIVIDPTVNESVVAGADDGFSIYGTDSGFTYGSFSAPYCDFGCYSAYGFQFIFYAGIRFQSVAVPQGASINSATLTLDIINIRGSQNGNVVGNDVDDAPVWGVNNQVTKISQTSAQVQITPTVSGSYPIGVTSIVKEIIDRSGWASGNNLAFAILPNIISGTHTITIAALEHATRTEAQLEIEYDEAAAAIVAPKMMHYRRLRI